MTGRATYAKAGLAIALLLVAGTMVSIVAGDTSSSGSAPARGLAFGSDVVSLDALAQAGAPSDYATFWVGTWNLRWGWSGPESDLAKAHAAGATPLIQFYYWGDDISPTCVENGCASDLHGGTKDKRGWQMLAEGLVTTLNAKSQGKPVVIVLETEFNKGGIETYEPFDGYLVEKANYFRGAYPSAILVLGFGNWGHDHWKTFDRAVAAVDMVGVQGMRGSTRNSLDSYLGLGDALLGAANRLKAAFAKPVLITDVALSSHPEPEWAAHQKDAVARIAAKRADLRAAGVVGLVYRSWFDNPTFDTKNYFGEAERHWGFAYPDGAQKPAAGAWLDFVAVERHKPACADGVDNDGDGLVDSGLDPGCLAADDEDEFNVFACNDGRDNDLDGRVDTADDPGCAAWTDNDEANAWNVAFAVSPNVNEWWLEVKVTSNHPVKRVDATVNGKTIALQLKSWGNWAASANAPRGATVQFRADVGEPSPTYSWLTFPATFTLSPNVNRWWVEVQVKSPEAVSKVEVLVNGKATALDLKDWGNWAKSMKVDAGSKVQFRAYDARGWTVASGTYTWA